jgi:hypothetical protein
LNTQYETVNNSEVVEIDEDVDAQIMKEDEDGVAPAGSKRKLTSIVWNEFSRVVVRGVVKAKCMYYFKYLSGTSNGTKHLHDHLKICTLKKIKIGGKKTLA